MIVAANKNAIADRSNGTGHDPRTSDGRRQNQTRKFQRLPAATLPRIPRNGLTQEQRKLAQALNMQAQETLTRILINSLMLMVRKKLSQFYFQEEARGPASSSQIPAAHRGSWNGPPDRSATATSFRASGKGG